MRSEKDLKTTLQTNSEHSHELHEVEESAVLKTRLYYFKIWLSKYRLKKRKELLEEAKTAYLYLPFVLGLWHFLTHKVSSNVYELFLQNNVPIFEKFQPELNSDTCLYIIKSNTDLNLESTKKNFLLGQPELITTIKTNVVSIPTVLEKEENREFTGLSCNFCVLSSENSFATTDFILQNLDELPAYLKGLNQEFTKSPGTDPLFFSEKQEKEILKDESLLFRKNTPQLHSKKRRFLGPQKFLVSNNKIEPKSSENKLTFIQESKNSRFHYEKNHSFENTAVGNNEKNENLEKTARFVHEKKKLLLKNSFFQNRLDFYETVDLLNTELENLFSEKEISLSSTADLQSLEKEQDFEILQKFFKQNDSVDENLVLDTILQNFETQKLSGELSGSRLMSGYDYPDTKTQQLRRFFKRNGIDDSFFAQKNLSEFKSKSSPLARNSVFGTEFDTTKYSITIGKLPKVLVQTKQILVERSQEPHTQFYEGLGLVLDSKRGLDWKTRTRGEDSLRSWFHEHLSILNPLTQTQENFFAFYKSPKFAKKKLNSPDLGNRSFFGLHYNKEKNNWVVGPNSPVNLITPTQSSVYIPITTKKGSFRGVNLGIGNSENISEEGSVKPEFLPIIEIQQPRFRSSSKNKVELTGHTPLFDLGITAKLDYHLYRDHVDLPEQYSYGGYKKIPTIFWRPADIIPVRFVADLAERYLPLFFGQNQPKTNNWEPLSSNSWLVLSQVSFAFFAFKVLSGLYDTYTQELIRYLIHLITKVRRISPMAKKELKRLLKKERAYRIVWDTKTQTSDVIGYNEYFLRERLIDTFFCLRGNITPYKKLISSGFLLVGPPGTGKGLFVKALAKDAGVPLIAVSASSLLQYEDKESAYHKLKAAFDEARRLEPCIVFVDELDVMGIKRLKLSTDHGTDLDFNGYLMTRRRFEPTDEERDMLTSPLEQLSLVRDQEDDDKETRSRDATVHYEKEPNDPERYALLAQLLVELDGMRRREGVVVFGATSNLQNVDKALLRYGRLETLIEVSLPHKEKRIKILQFYAKRLGYQPNLPWDYVGERTVGFAGSDLVKIINESAVKAILIEKDSLHTVKTIEFGIDRLTSARNEKPGLLKFLREKSTPNQSSRRVFAKFMILRHAYYQVGKTLLSYCLENHPKTVAATLWPQRSSLQSLQITTNLESTIVKSALFSEIHDRLIGCYGGKAAEFLFLANFSSQRLGQLSTLGVEDLRFAQELIYHSLEKFYFYSKRTHTQRFVTLVPNVNEREYIYDLMQIQLEGYAKIVEETGNPSLGVKKMRHEKLTEEQKRKKKKRKRKEYPAWNKQTKEYFTWWFTKDVPDLEFQSTEEKQQHFNYYMQNPERTWRNIEWVYPDEYYYDQYSKSALKSVKTAFADCSTDFPTDNFYGKAEEKREEQEEKIIDQGQKTEQAEQQSQVEQPLEEQLEKTTDQDKQEEKQEKQPEDVYKYWEVDKYWDAYLPWNEISAVTRDYPAHSLALQSFNKALVLLNQNRELLDHLVIELVYNEILRKPEIETFVQDFKVQTVTHKKQNLLDSFEKETGIKVVELSWGLQSRKPVPRWIDFRQFSSKNK
uniref:ATP-dependent zinc metalloprotease FtsH n=1 Tax=Chlorella heliozoae TaxID=554066 RepID=A0A2I4S6T3_9CHLO|nr:ATP-dependent zinc metalloprotease FtsH [Chlorella heliozoae]AST08748.1 ATP-dependent zinc metalloprotease FtsH [Chlorella heliozoae]